MNPFDQPPIGAPVSFAHPSASHGGHDGPRRGRMAIAALAAAGLVGGGIVVVGQFASADDRPSLDAAEIVDEPSPDAPAADDGFGDPAVLDLGAITECLGSILGDGPLFGPDGEGMPPLLFDDEFSQRMEEFFDGLPLDDLDLDLDLDDGVRIFGSGGSIITVVGPDGVELIDLGEGDATVTIEQTDGELTIETDGDATMSELPDVSEMLSELGELFPDLGELDLGELDPGELDLGGWPELGDIESCFDD